MKTYMKVEIPEGCRLKYEEDKITGEFVADRIVPISYPAAYGYIPNTLADDGDPLDVFLITQDMSLGYTFPGVSVPIEIVGIMQFLDNGIKDDKVIAIVRGSKVSDNFLATEVNRIASFLETYKPSHPTKVGEYLGRVDALDYLKYCELMYSMDSE